MRINSAYAVPGRIGRGRRSSKRWRQITGMDFLAIVVTFGVGLNTGWIRLFRAGHRAVRIVGPHRSLPSIQSATPWAAFAHSAARSQQIGDPAGVGAKDQPAHLC
jgi:hypothetical protein